MADAKLLDVPHSVSPREVEQFKHERIAENIFLVSLGEALSVLRDKVGKQNRVVMSMERFLRGRR